MSEGLIEDTSRKFSPSKLATYKECPRKYKFRYIDGLKRTGQTVEQFMGTCVHSAFEALYEGLQKGRRLSEDETVAVFEKAWDAGFAEVVAGPQGAPDKDEWGSLGRQCVRNYFRQYAPFEQDRTVAVEKRIGFPVEVAGETYALEGFIDRLALSADDGAFEIHDYKTAKNLPAQAYVDQDWQLALYEIAVRHQWPDTKAVRLKWHYVRFAKTLASTRTADQRDALKAEVGALIGKLKADHEFAPHESNLCGWCDYRSLCPLFAHGEQLSEKPVELRSLDEGRKAVDALSSLEEKRKALRAQIKEIEAQEEPLKERLIAYAAKNGFQVVSGTHDEAAIIAKEHLKFPTKTDSPERFERLEAELRETPLWKKAAHFDAHRFVEGWKAKEWAPELRALADSIVERFAQRLTETALRLRRRRDADD